MKKKKFVVIRVKCRMKLILEKRGKDYDSRLRRIAKNSLTAIGGPAYRASYRERAKEIVHDFLKQSFE